MIETMFAVPIVPEKTAMRKLRTHRTNGRIINRGSYNGETKMYISNCATEALDQVCSKDDENACAFAAAELS